MNGQGQFNVPDGLTEVLEQFVISVLRHRPPDLIDYAAQYFEDLRGAGGTGATNNHLGLNGAGASLQLNQRDYSSGSESEAEPPPNYTTKRRKSVSAERYDPSQDSDTEDIRVVHPKTDEQRKKLLEVIRPILLFKALDKEQMSFVVDAMFALEVKEGDEIITQGDEIADNFYVIDSGKFEVVIDKKVVSEYKDSGSFGELALMYDQARAATIRASSAGSLWALDRRTFRRIVLKSAFLKRKMYEKLIDSVKILRSLKYYEKMNVADALVTQEFEDEEKIIVEGDAANCMYFVESGEVRVIKKDTRGSGIEKEVARCQKGGFFGELALLTKKPRAATVISVGHTRCAVLDVEAFERLLGPCKNIMRRNHAEYERNLEAAFGEKVDMAELR